jgi:hypothetical protein
MGHVDDVVHKFSNFDYVQVHADFIQDHSHLDGYVCFCNEVLPKRKKYEQFNRARSFNIWFTNFDGTPFVYHTDEVSKALTGQSVENVRVDTTTDFANDIHTQEQCYQVWQKDGGTDRVKEGSTIISADTHHSYVFNERLRRWVWLAEPRVAHFVLELMLEY